MLKITIIVIAKNESDCIADCFKSAAWADKVLLLDGDSTDDTQNIARSYKVKIVPQQEKTLNYAAWHNEGQKAATGDWIFYLDADERFTPELVIELRNLINSDPPHSAYAVPRYNYLLKKRLLHGGWYPDYQVRLFKNDKLKRWSGKLHEHPEYIGTLGYLNNQIVHIQPDTIEPALKKSIKWSQTEAELLYLAHHPHVVWWRVLRMGLTTLFDRLVKKQGFRDGIEGWIESLYQSFHTMMVYLRLWEKQQL